MKMLTLSIILVTFPCLSHATGYYVRGYDDDSFWQAVEDQQCRQSDLIASGVKSGQLTRREIKKLRREQKHVARQIKQFRRHRHFGYEYQRELLQHLDYVSEQISHLKHNNDYNHRRYNHNPFTRYKNRKYERSNHNSAWINGKGSTRYYRF